MKKLIITILLLVFTMSCRIGFTFDDLNGVWKKEGSSETFRLLALNKIIIKDGITYNCKGVPDGKYQSFYIILFEDNYSYKIGDITFTSKTDAEGTGEFSGIWTKL